MFYDKRGSICEFIILERGHAAAVADFLKVDDQLLTMDYLNAIPMVRLTIESQNASTIQFIKFFLMAKLSYNPKTLLRERS